MLKRRQLIDPPGQLIHIQFPLKFRFSAAVTASKPPPLSKQYLTRTLPQKIARRFKGNRLRRFTGMLSTTGKPLFPKRHLLIDGAGKQRC
jgi:hypothetical protein